MAFQTTTFDVMMFVAVFALLGHVTGVLAKGPLDGPEVSPATESQKGEPGKLKMSIMFKTQLAVWCRINNNIIIMKI